MAFFVSVKVFSQLQVSKVDYTVVSLSYFLY